MVLSVTQMLSYFKLKLLLKAGVMIHVFHDHVLQLTAVSRGSVHLKLTLYGVPRKYLGRLEVRKD